MPCTSFMLCINEPARCIKYCVKINTRTPATSIKINVLLVCFISKLSLGPIFTNEFIIKNSNSDKNNAIAAPSNSYALISNIFKNMAQITKRQNLRYHP